MKIAIVGSHRETRDLAPFDDPDTEIWVFNEALSQRIRDNNGEPYHWVKRADVVFQMHDPAVYKSQNNRSDIYHWDWLQKDHGTLKIYMQDVDPEVPNSVRYPREEINALLDNMRQGLDLQHREFFTSSVAQAFALAVLQKPEKILVYGVEMRSETEYYYQRECVLFWEGYALGRGIPMDIYSQEDVFTRPTYGYEGYIWADPEFFREAIEERREEIPNIKKIVRDQEDEMEDNWTSDRIEAMLTNAGKYNTMLGKLEGQVAELERYLFKAEEYVKDGKTAYIDRNEYEMASAQAHRDMERLGPMVYRTVGHVDMVLGTYRNTRNPVQLEQFKQFARKHIDANYNYGRAQGIYDINRELAFDMDKRLKAAGGTKTVQSIMRTEENKE